MKTLQNNFTTPEQSERLLELGVPADSADMLWDGSIDANEGWIFEDFPRYSDKPFSYYQLLYRQEDVVHILPCWSVGRLMEIWKMCGNGAESISAKEDTTQVDLLVKLYEENATYADFSKLDIKDED